MMRAAFRVDASLAMGTGHVMRCLTLAMALREKGAQVLFACRQHKGNFCDFLEGKGFDVARLVAAEATAGLDSESPPGSSHPDWLGTSWEIDAAQTLSAIEGWGAPDWLIVDHYGIESSWEAALGSDAWRLMVIDDLANRKHQCDLLLDQNCRQAGDARYDGLVPPECQKLLGPDFALLRTEFASARARPKVRDGTVKRLLVFYGGVDQTNETTKAIHAIQALERPDLRIDVVVGRTNPHREAVEVICASNRNFCFHNEVTNLAELMAGADLALGAGGGALLERCSLALPSIVVSVASNQKAGCAALESIGAIRYLGDSGDVSIEQVTESLRDALQSPGALAQMAASAGRVVDAQGTRRVVQRLSRQPIVLRRAVPTDCEPVWAWRNAEVTRRFSKDPSPITLNEHRTWFESVLKDPNRDLLLAEDDSGAVGVVRFDTDQESARISVYLATDRHGSGLGTEVIEAGTKWIRRNRPALRKVVAEIRPENLASIRAFSRAGFIGEGPRYVLGFEGE